MNTYRRGFTIIELLFVIVLLSSATILFFVQRNNVEIATRDENRKTAINAMYYGLEEVYHKQTGSYPRTIDEKVLPSVDPELFKDPQGVKLGEANSDYRYEPFDCDGDICHNYSLRTTLENEDDYVKEARS